MKIVITGGNGFLGSNIAKELVSLGHEVISIQRSDPVVIQKLEGVRYVQGDLTNLLSFVSAFEGADVVFHVAAFAAIWGPWDEFFSINYQGSLNVVEACKQFKVKKLIFTSTPSVVFSGESIRGGNETLPYGSHWLCHYAETKHMAEEYVLSDQVAESLDVVSLRPHLIWGEGDPHLLPRVVGRARDGGLKIVGDGKNKVDITHVSNATQAHLLAMDKLLTAPEAVRQKAYFISDDEPVELWEWIQQLLERMVIPKVKKKVSFGLVYRIAHFMELWYRFFRAKGEPPMTRFVAIELAKDHYFDISAAKRDLGYAPVRTSEAMDKMVEYLKQL